ncbi:hypothetical protein [Legionella fairfieldensis]|uniref:hypothetical protein n=1 Tax=Legionella fairfieldensis TaxID=45064 RepID=UPI00068892D4|nr:hypothetical protein [Legionella fairfieldensis]
MNRSTQVYYKRAQALGLDAVYIPEIGSLKISLGKKNYYFMATITPFNQGASIFIAKNKFFLNTLLARNGFSVPKALIVNQTTFTQYSLEKIVKDLKFPLVVKPVSDTSRGKDVLCNIKEISHLSACLTKGLQRYTAMQIEEFHPDLREYRVLILKNRVIGVVERFGASVTGDGKHTIAQLIAIKNQDIEKVIHTLTVSPLVVDEEYQQCLAEQGLDLTSIPPANKRVRLCYTANTGRGGDILSLGKKINKKNALCLINAAKAAGLDFVGFDVLCEDINIPFNEKWFILEGNFHPDITLHEVSNQGKKVPVATAILRQLIFRHPFAYVKHWFGNSRFSFYLKIIFFITALLLILFLLS